MPTIQEQIDALQAQIDETKGTGTSPLPCSIVGLNNKIAGLEAMIKELRTSRLEEENPFSGTTMTLRLDAKNIPSLAGTNQAAAMMINAIGIKPAAINMDGVVVSASGNAGITVIVQGETDAMVATAKLAAFAVERNITIDVTQVQTTAAGNMDRAEQYLELATVQEGIITKLHTDGATIVPEPQEEAP